MPCRPFLQKPTGICAGRDLGYADRLGIQSLRLAITRSDLAGEKLALSDFKAKLARKARAPGGGGGKVGQTGADLKNAIADARAVGAQTKTEIQYVQSNGGPCVTDTEWRAITSGVSLSLARRQCRW